MRQRFDGVAASKPTAIFVTPPVLFPVGMSLVDDTPFTGPASTIISYFTPPLRQEYARCCHSTPYAFVQTVYRYRPYCMHDARPRSHRLCSTVLYTCVFSLGSFPLGPCRALLPYCRGLLSRLTSLLVCVAFLHSCRVTCAPPSLSGILGTRKAEVETRGGLRVRVRPAEGHSSRPDRPGS